MMVCLSVCLHPALGLDLFVCVCVVSGSRQVLQSDDRVSGVESTGSCLARWFPFSYLVGVPAKITYLILYNRAAFAFSLWYMPVRSENPVFRSYSRYEVAECGFSDCVCCKYLSRFQFLCQITHFLYKVSSLVSVAFTLQDPKSPDWWHSFRFIALFR